MHSLNELKVAVVGLGYVGLPLAVEFGKRRPVVGFDINARASRRCEGRDITLEVSDEELAAATGMQFTADVDDLEDCNVYIVTVPTPIDEYKRPDLTPLIGASETIGSVLKKGDVVIYESTVYPGATEEDACRCSSGVGPEVQRRFLRGLQPRAHQPGRQEAPLPRHQEGHVGLDAGSRRTRRRAVSRRSSRRARTRRAASASPKRPRSSRTRSATSTSR